MTTLDPAGLVRMLRQTTPPTEIWQQPFDFDPGHYKRLCDPHRRPSNSDLIDYANDYQYGDSVQPDLLRFLLPRLLKAWGEDLLDETADYGGFSEHCLSAFAKKPLYPTYLDEKELRAVSDYVEALILNRMSKEKHLHHCGMMASPYKWFYALGSFIVVFPYLEHLWRTWWVLETEPSALCAVEYVSCLMYEDDSNPVFEPWTPKQGGGPPSLWETDGHIFDQVAQPANIAFLESTLTSDYVREKLVIARNVVTQSDNRSVIERMSADFETQLPLLRKRLAALPRLFARAREHVMHWDDVL